VRRIFFWFFFTSQIVSLSFADIPNDIRLGTPNYGGSGCPINSATVTLSPDAPSLSILFDTYITEAGGTNARIARRTCNIAIPVHVPQGYSISIFSIDYRGFNSLPLGAYSRYTVEYFFAGARGPILERTFQGLLNSNYFIHHDFSAEALIWSRCGDSVILRASISMLVETNAALEPAFATVDSVDVDAGITFHLQWKDC